MKVEGRARLVLDYNTSVNNPELIEWLQSVYKAGLKPYITLRECEQEEGIDTPCPSHPPTIKEYQKDVESLMKAFKQENKKEKLPAVTVWGAWNEPDGAKNPFHHHKAKRAALFWKIAQHAAFSIFHHAHRYTVVAGEFEQYYPEYTKEYRKAILTDHAFWAGKPHVWGLHDYHDILRSGELGHYVTEDARKFLSLGDESLGHPHMWISEAGVELLTGKKKTPLAGEGETELKRQRIAAKDFLQLAKVAREIHGSRPSEYVYQYIEWLYYYLYRSPSKAQRKEHFFDSALLEVEPTKPEYEEREAYCILALGKSACPARVGTEAPVAGATTSNASTVLLTVDPRGLLTEYFVAYGTSTAYGHVTSSSTITNDVGAQSETVGLSGLESCTTYHYQAEAESSANEGTPSLGGDKTFTTGGCDPPTVTTDGPRYGIDGRELTGTIDPNGKASTYYFEYGPTKAYGHTTPSEDAGSGTTSFEVETEVEIEPFMFGGEGSEREREEIEQEKEEEEGEEGAFELGGRFHPDILICGKSWHFRLVGMSAGGTSYGADVKIPRCI